MERFVIGIAIGIIIYASGYRSGFRACFDYIKEEMKKHRDEQYKRNNVGDD